MSVVWDGSPWKHESLILEDDDTKVVKPKTESFTGVRSKWDFLKLKLLVHPKFGIL